MITNSKTTNRSSRQKRSEAARKKRFRRMVSYLDACVIQIENSDDPKIKRAVELGKQHLPLSKIMEIVDKEFPEE